MLESYLARQPWPPVPSLASTSSMGRLQVIAVDVGLQRCQALGAKASGPCAARYPAARLGVELQGRTGAHGGCHSPCLRTTGEDAAAPWAEGLRKTVW